MTQQWGTLAEAGLQFFGKMSASISHEIKNALAIMNEHAGLLEDIAIAAGKGKAIDPERLRNQAGRIMKQIQRADGIIKNMNRFSHSVDEPVKSVDLREIVELVCLLSGRLAALKGVTLDLAPTAGLVAVTTSPFFLENLVWLCLDFAVDAVGSGNTIHLSTEGLERGGRIRLSGLQGLSAERIEGFPGEREEAVLRALEAELEVNGVNGEIILTLPGHGKA